MQYVLLFLDKITSYILHRYYINYIIVISGKFLVTGVIMQYLMANICCNRVKDHFDICVT